MSNAKRLILNIVIWAVIGAVVAVVLHLISHFAEIEIPLWVSVVIICAIGGMTSWQVAEIFAKKAD